MLIGHLTLLRDGERFPVRLLLMHDDRATHFHRQLQVRAF